MIYCRDNPFLAWSIGQKGPRLRLIILPSGSPRRADSKSLIGGLIGWILAEIRAVDYLQGGRVGESTSSHLGLLLMPFGDASMDDYVTPTVNVIGWVLGID